jgi:cell division protein FtsZ
MGKRAAGGTRRAVCVAGVGAGGVRVADAVAGEGQDLLVTAAIDSDAAELGRSRATAKLQIGRSLLSGMGAGGDARLGGRAAADDISMIRSLFEDVEVALVVAGLGGGTGTGAAPVVLRAARDAGAATLCVATLPFGFEGRQRQDRAQAAIVDLLGAAEALVVMQNDRLFEAVGKQTVADSFREADRALGQAVGSVWRLLLRPGYLNLGFPDLRRIVRNSGGMCTLGYGGGTGRNRVERALAELMDGPLLARGRVIAEAKGMLVSIVGGPDLTLQEIGEVMNAVKARAKAAVEVEVGTAVDESARGRLWVTVIASEAWSSAGGGGEPDGGAIKVVATPAAAAAPAPSPAPASAEKRPRATQTRLNLDTTGRGRFKDVQPTVLEGEDLDIPTFARRGIRVER